MAEAKRNYHRPRDVSEAERELISGSPVSRADKISGTVRPPDDLTAPNHNEQKGSSWLRQLDAIYIPKSLSRILAELGGAAPWVKPGSATR